MRCIGILASISLACSSTPVYFEEVEDNTGGVPEIGGESTGGAGSGGVSPAPTASGGTDSIRSGAVMAGMDTSAGMDLAGGDLPMGTAGTAPNGGGMTATTGGEAEVDSTPEEGCTPTPPNAFQTTVVTATGPGGGYTIYQPAILGEGGFLHPPVAWGSGAATTPDLYVQFLENVASNGFIVIANSGTGSDAQVVRQGLEWLIEQNAAGGEYAGRLAAECAGTIGYSRGGGAAVGAGSHPAVKAIVSIHGVSDAAQNASGAILLTTSEGDTYVTKDDEVVPCYDLSSVQPTMLASHSSQDSAPLFGDHLEPLDNGGLDAEPAIAWLRYWIYGDPSQRDWFFDDGCRLCSWEDVRRKNHPEWD